MTEHIKIFNTAVEQQAYHNDDPTTPVVSLSVDLEEVLYEKEEPDWSQHYFYVEGLEKGYLEIATQGSASPYNDFVSDIDEDTGIELAIQYSYDEINWNLFTNVEYNEYNSSTSRRRYIARIPIKPYQKIYLKSYNRYGASSVDDSGWINCVGVDKESLIKYNVGGWLDTLTAGDYAWGEDENWRGYVNYQYTGLFRQSNLLSAKNLIFSTYMAQLCYRSMFSDCFLLQEGPKILPAMTLSSRCYMGMFENCILLKKAPILLAFPSGSGSYRRMFRNCYSLNYIKVISSNSWSSSLTEDWTEGVQTRDGIFVMNSSAPWDPATIENNTSNPNKTYYTYRNYEDISDANYITLRSNRIPEYWQVIIEPDQNE